MLGIVILLYIILIPMPMTTINTLKVKAFPIKEKYENVSLYDDRCDERAILTVAVYYLEAEKYKDCKEWIERRNKCISLHKKQNKKTYRKYDTMCEQDKKGKNAFH